MSITVKTRRESYELLDNETLYKHIISVLKKKSSLTAREIAQTLYEEKYIPYPVRQAVAPRLTELVDEGILIVSGKVYDEVTKRHVAAYRLVEK